MPDKHDDIGPVYKGFGALLLIVAMGIFAIHASQGHPIGLHDVLFLAIAVLFCLALWRPDKFDNVMKTIGNKLPIPYRKPDNE